MNEAPGSSKANACFGKNPKGKHVTTGQKKMIIHAYMVKKKKKPDIRYKPLIAEVAEETGIGRGTIIRTIASYKKTGRVSSPNRTRKKSSIFDNTDESTKLAIRQKVYDFWHRREVPTLVKISTAINNDPKMPNYSLTTLHRILKSLNFKYKVQRRHNVLSEQRDIVVWRRNYLRQIQEYREEGRKIYYLLDETWVNTTECCKKAWQDTSKTASNKAKSRQLPPGIPQPTGKGKRLTVLHIGSTDGFVPDGLLCFESKMKSSDHHDATSSKKFFKWFENILPRLEENCVIVVDNGAFHSVKLEDCPTSKWAKDSVIEWLRSKGARVPDDSLKIELMETVRNLRPRYLKYLIDEYAERQNRRVLRLPPHHCDYNPIELVWSAVKNFVQKIYTTYKLSDAKDLLIAGVNNVTADNWKNYIEHTKSVERKFWAIDEIVDELEDAAIEEENGRADNQLTDNESEGMSENVSEAESD